MRITILALGTRGDVQPYVALGLGLQRAGHKVRLVAFSQFKAFVESRGLDFFSTGVDTHELLETDKEARAISLHRWPYTQLYGQAVPMLYGYSPVVVPKPSDWNEHVHVTGYWFLDHASDWQPPADLVDFLGSGPPLIYIGFGSLLSRGSEKASRIVLDALKQSGQRGVMATGWGGLSQSDLPDEVFSVESVPHDWLFPRMAAVVHHGGAGTTGAGLRAGVPSIVIPFSKDQPFWARRVKALGAGPDPIPRKRLTASRLAHAMRVAVMDESIRKRAAVLGQTIRAEDGVGNAIRVFSQTVGDHL
jgi:sterol 3beta-glucosyltransferase